MYFIKAKNKWFLKKIENRKLQESNTAFFLTITKYLLKFDLNHKKIKLIKGFFS